MQCNEGQSPPPPPPPPPQSEVALAAALHADLAEGQDREEAHVPGDHEQPELVANRGGLQAAAAAAQHTAQRMHERQA